MPQPQTNPATPAPIHLRLPGFILDDEEIGLGDIIKRATSSLRIRPCRGCVRRAVAQPMGGVLCAPRSCSGGDGGPMMPCEWLVNPEPGENCRWYGDDTFSAVSADSTRSRDEALHLAKLTPLMERTTGEWIP